MSGPRAAALAAVTAIAAAVAASCAETRPRDPLRAGLRFDPSTLRPGDRVGALVADSVVARVTPADSSYVGTARFRGEIELTGATLRHPESDVQSICFEADSASAARLPRWQDDERRPWFCFENEVDARRALGSSSTGLRATIVIDRFTIHRGLSDQVNSARLVRVVAPGGSVVRWWRRVDQPREWVELASAKLQGKELQRKELQRAGRDPRHLRAARSHRDGEVRPRVHAATDADDSVLVTEDGTKFRRW